MKIVAWGNGSGSQMWRLEHPFKHLRSLGIDANVCHEAVSEKYLEWADIAILQSCVHKESIALAYQYQQEKGLKLIVESDDWMEVNEDNPHKLEHDVLDASFTIQRTMEVSDAVTTTQDYLSDKIKTINSNTFVLPNYIYLKEWDLPKYKNESDTIRIFWAGSMTHLEDMKLVVNPIKRICKEFPNVQLVFMGDTRIGDLFDGCNVENMLGVPVEVWPVKLSTIRADIGIAPLIDNEFNRCKSNIKWLEYGINQIPSVCSPTRYGESIKNGDTGYIANTEEDWYKNIKKLVIDKGLREKIGMNAYEEVKKNWSLEGNIQKWVDVYKSLTK